MLHDDKAPEFSCIEVVQVSAALLVQVLAARRRRPLERILADVNDRRHISRDLFSWPALRLLVELEFEIINPKSTQVRPAEIKELMATRRPFAKQQLHLLVAVEEGL